MAFADALFSFMRRKTNLLHSPSSVEQIQRMALKHVEQAKKERDDSKKAPPSSVPCPTNPSTSSSSSSSSSSSPSSSSSVTAPLPASTTGAPAVPERAMDLEAKEIPSVDASSASKGAAPVNRGAVTPRYTWTQTLSEVTVTLPPLPAGTASKALSVSISASHVSVALRSALSAPLLPSTALNAAVRADDSTWTLEAEGGAKVLRLYLPKAKGMEWWPRLLVDEEPPIDVTKIEPENSQLSDLDGETRATVEKMMLEQRTKAAAAAGGGGHAPLDDSGKEAALKRFMDAHPEMDFSQAKFS